MKNGKIQILNSVLAILVGLSLIACGKKQGSATSVNVEFANQTGSVLSAELRAVGPRAFLPAIELQSSSLLGETPLIYQMKFVAIYLVEAIDPVTYDNVGDMTRIWASRKCDDDLRQCGVSETSAPYIVDYFNFAVGTAAVNQEFASFKRTNQNATINPGTYNYIRMDFSGRVIEGVNDTAPNLMFGTMEGHEVRAQQYAFTVELPEPLVLGEGETFTVNLAYDLENRFYESGNSSSRPAEVPESSTWTCDGVGAGVPCIVEAEFSPTVTKN